MKTILNLFFVLILSDLSFTTEVFVVRKNMNDKLNTVKSGAYKIKAEFKFFSNPDTIKSEGRVWFEKLPVERDSFLIKYLVKTGESMFSVFDGKKRYAHYSDTTAKVAVYDAVKHSSLIYGMGSSFRNLQYEYFFRMKKSELSSDTSIHFKLMDDKVINSEECYVLSICENDNLEEEITDYYRTIYIRKKDFLPVRFEEGMNWQDMHQYQTAEISEIELDNTVVGFSPDTLSARYYLKEFERKETKILQPGDTLPEWKLSSINGESIQSSSLPSQYIFIDFWYRSCGPCIKSMPALQKLHDEFKSKGLTVIGINPFDKNDSALKSFLNYRNITYPILTEGLDVAQKFKVTAYPTYFLIDNIGQILYSGIGYDEKSEDELRRIFNEKVR